MNFHLNFIIYSNRFEHENVVQDPLKIILKVQSYFYQEKW